MFGSAQVRSESFTKAGTERNGFDCSLKGVEGEVEKVGGLVDQVLVGVSGHTGLATVRGTVVRHDISLVVGLLGAVGKNRLPTPERVFARIF